MFDHRQFVQNCLSAITGLSLISPSQASPLVNPPLKPLSSSQKEFLTNFGKAVATAPKIRLIGVGGAGGNAAHHMIDSRVSDMDYIFY